MKTYSPEWLAAIAAGDGVSHGAVKIVPRVAVEGEREPIAEGTVAELTWLQCSFDQAVDDEARMGLVFLDADGAEIGAVDWSAYASPLIWTERSHSTAAPADAYDLRVYMDMLRHTGSNNDGYIDAIVCTLGGVPLDLQNPGAETGDTFGWVNQTGAIGIRAANPLPDAGAAYFYGGGTPHTVAYQDIDVAGDGLGSTEDGEPLCFWGGYGDLILDAGDGPETYVGVGDRGLVTVTGRRIGTAEQSIELTLSGVDPDIDLNTAVARDASVLIWRLGFDSSGRTLLDASVFDRGKVDDLFREEVVGGEATIRLMVEGAARGLGRSTNRMCTDADQRNIRDSDPFFSKIGYAHQKKLYWGGPKPLRNNSVPETGFPS